jgi:UrcA family protein
MKTIHILAAFAATFAGTLAASPSAAMAPASVERVVVGYADLDLSSRAGVAQLNRRVLTAVQTACGATSDSDLRGKNAADACRHREFAAAMAQARGAIALARGDGPTVLAGR